MKYFAFLLLVISRIGFQKIIDQDFSSALQLQFHQVGQDGRIFSVSVMSVDNTGDTEPDHGGTYLGTDRSGQEYVFTKNGRVTAPQIQTAYELLNDVYTDRKTNKAGTVLGYYNPD